MKEKLNRVSPSFCLAKWMQVSIHLTTGRTHSCYHPVPHKIPLSEIESNPTALHNTQYKKEQRKLMLEGKRPAECQYCWAVEDLGSERMSDRFFRSSETWAAEKFNEISQMPWDADIMPSYVEVNFNHACQLKCLYCSPILSSSWMQEMKKNGPYNTIGGHVPLDYIEKIGLMPIPDPETNPYVKAFWKWWPDLYPNLRVFRMTGGEPLLDENTFRVFEYAKAHPHKDLSLSITSNMCPPDKSFDRFIRDLQVLKGEGKIKDFLLFASVDSVGDHAEYIRTGLDFKKFTRNVERYLTEIPHSTISFINTFNALSITRFPQFLDYVQDLRRRYNKDFQRVHFDTPRLYSPGFLSCQILQPSYFDQIDAHVVLMKSRRQKNEQDLIGFSDSEIERLERVAEWVRVPMDEKLLLKHRIDFYLLTKDYDARQGKQFRSLFPEMKDFHSLCASLAMKGDSP